MSPFNYFTLSDTFFYQIVLFNIYIAIMSKVIQQKMSQVYVFSKIVLDCGTECVCSFGFLKNHPSSLPNGIRLLITVFPLQFFPHQFCSDCVILFLHYQVIFRDISRMV